MKVKFCSPLAQASGLVEAKFQVIHETEILEALLPATGDALSIGFNRYRVTVANSFLNRNATRTWFFSVSQSRLDRAYKSPSVVERDNVSREGKTS
jgi:hypothetical protein